MSRPMDQVFGFTPRYPDADDVAESTEDTPSPRARKPRVATPASTEASELANQRVDLAERIQAITADDAPARIRAEGTCRVCTLMPVSLHRRCKLFCAEHGISMNLLLSQVWADLEDALDELGA